ncbi:MAG: flavin reductase (DIM6/NTAB) family NADH-FMN oxidoreductase RutF [Parasphingorhabdus sp.]
MAIEPDPIMRQSFLDAMSHTASSVNVVTTDGPAGRAGVTVSAMTSVSADTPKPTLLVCVHHLSASATAIVENGVFCVNVLRDDQSYISDTFASRIETEDGDKFSCTDWVNFSNGSPRVADPLVAFSCRMISGERIGTHHVFLGEVEDVHLSERGSPLIFSNRSYGIAKPITPGGISSVNSAELSIGCYSTFGPYIIPEILERFVRSRGGLDLNLVEGHEERLTEALLNQEVELAFVYDYDLDDSFAKEVLTTLPPHVLLAEGHPLAEQQQIEPEQLVDYPLILLDVPSSRDYFLSIFKAEGLDPLIGFESSNFEMVRGLVGHGLGYGLLHTKPASGMSYDGRSLVTRPVVTTVEPNPVLMIHNQDHELSETAKAFADLVRSYFHSSTDT